METQSLAPSASAIDSYKYGWQQMKKYFLPLLLVILVLIVAEIPTGMADVKVEDGEMKPIGPLHVISLLYWILLLPVFQYGAHYVNLKAARSQEFEVKEMFSGFNKYFNVVLANLLVFALVGMGLVVFIIPGIIILCRLAFVPYLVMDQDLGPVAAVEKSWKITKGYGWTVFGMGLLAIPIILVGFILVFVGVIFAAMWILVSFAGLYYAVSLERQNEGTVEVGEFRPS